MTKWKTKVVSFTFSKLIFVEEGLIEKRDSELKLIESSEDTFEDGNFKNRLV